MNEILSIDRKPSADEKKHVLLVDDEIEAIEGYREYLDHFFHIHLAGSVKDALEVLKVHEVAVLVSDMIMPGEDGVTLLSVANREFQRPIKIVLSAYVDTFFDEDFQNSFRVYAVLRKPLTSLSMLLRYIDDAAKEYDFRYPEPGKPEPAYLTAEEVMIRIGISRPTLYKYIRSGLPSRQVLGRRFFDWDEITRWMNKLPQTLANPKT